MKKFAVIILGLFLSLATSLAIGAELPLKEGKLLIYGDSLSAGYGIAQGQEWVSILKERIHQSGFKIEVVNASISGETSAGGAVRIQSVLAAEKPQWVLIELGGNDGLRGLSLVAMQTQLQIIIDAIKRKDVLPLLVGMKIPPNYGRKYTQKFESAFQDLAQRNNIPLLPFLLEGVGGDASLMQSDRIHPNTKAQSIVADLVWDFLQQSQVIPKD